EPAWARLLSGGVRNRLLHQDDLVAEQPLSLLDATLEIADRVHLPQIHPNINKGLGDLGRQAGDDDGRPEKPRRIDGLYQVIGHGRVDVRHTRDIQHDDLRPVRPDAAEQLLGQLAGALRIDDADDRQDEQALAHLENRSRQLSNGLLLLADNALPLLHEADGDGGRDAVGGGLVGVEDAVELVEVLMVGREQRAREDIAEEEHDADDLVRLDASRDDALGEI